MKKNRLSAMALTLACITTVLALLMPACSGGAPAPTAAPAPTVAPAPTTAPAATAAPKPTSAPAPTAAPKPTAAPAAPKVSNVIIVTSASTGSWYPVGSALGELITKYAGIKATAQTTSGAGENARLVSGKQAEIGFVASDALQQAVTGTGSFSGQKITNLRTLISLSPSLMSVVVANDSPIKSIADLKGKKVNFGPQGSSTAIVAEYILESANINSKTDLSAVYTGFTDLFNQYRDGIVDAVFIHGAHPLTGLVDAATRRPMRLLTIDGALRDAIIKKHPDTMAGVIKGGVYSQAPTDTQTLASALFWVTFDGFSDAAGYDIVKAVLEHLREADASHPSIKDIRKENALDGVFVPLNPGARKYYEEIKDPKLANVPQ